MFQINLRSVGNPDHGQTAPQSEPKTVTAKTIEELSKALREYIEEWNLGGGNLPPIKVFNTKTKKVVGELSYNGRFWPVQKKFKRGVDRPASGSYERGE